ncbi:tyrosine protein phosphatase non receptor type [Echinococcus multilocularis]|uniref:Tyrosine protein phosphatase non receptor type n=1 Tax=Echinococcus multilocularis TaxID=6211 RepID=A0A068YDX6_ECHMU|nr:tyrosine protein phosphatase non receptor type [Echinococcus multilocularis]
MNGNSNPHFLYNDAFHDSDQNISQMCTSPDCVSANIPPPQLPSSPKGGFHSVLSFWSGLEQASSQSTSVTTPRCTLLPTDRSPHLRSGNVQLSSGTTSDMDSISNSTSSKPLTGGPVKAPDSSFPSIHSEDSSDIDSCSATYERIISAKPPKIMKPQSIQSNSFFPPNGIGFGGYTNLPVESNSRSRLVSIKREESPPILPPKSPLLSPLSRIIEAEKYLQTVSLNGYKTMPHLNGNKHDFEAKINSPVKSSAVNTPHNRVGNNNYFNPNFRYSFNRPPEKPPKSAAIRSTSVYPRVQTSLSEKPIRPSSEMQTSKGLLQVHYPYVGAAYAPFGVSSLVSTSRMETNHSPTRAYNKPPSRRSSVPKGEEITYRHGYSNVESMKSNGYANASSCLCSGWRIPRPSSEMRHHQSTKTSSRSATGGGVGGVATDTSSVSPNTSNENLLTVRIRPSPEGQYGFNVCGGVDYKRPVIVSRVGDNLPAGAASPRLHRGDQIIRINDRDISGYTQEQVINSIQKAAKSRTGYLELVVKPDANYLEDDVMDDQSTDSGDAPPRPPKASVTETPTGMWLTSNSSSPSQRLDVSPSNHHFRRCQSQQPKHQQQFQMGPPASLPKPRINISGTVRDKSTSGMGLRKALTSGTESLYLSIRDIANGLADGSLVRKFEKLEQGDPHATTLDAQTNGRKNRYRDVSPYDHTRVKILGADGDYINASFIEMTIPKAVLRKYIASQGPLKTTCADFWQMCWEHDSELIVMLTDVGEQGREKCHKYWPNENETFEFAWIQPKSSKISTSPSDKCIQLRISNIKEEEKGNTAYREFQVQRSVTTIKDATTAGLSLKPNKTNTISFSRGKGPSVLNGAEVRRIVQLQYIRWPDHGVPSNCTDLIAFVEWMRELRDRGKSACAVVHCSAGIGRTGVVILLDTAMDMIHAQSPVRPIEMVREMRMFRKRLVQTTAQFQFVCEAIVKYHSDTMLKRSPIKKS